MVRVNKVRKISLAEKIHVYTKIKLYKLKFL